MEKVFQVINELVGNRVIDTYAVGGAVAAFFYIEPFFTQDIDIFFPVSLESSSIISLGPLYEHLLNKGYRPSGEMIEIEGWQVQFLPVANKLIDEAVENADLFEVGGVNVRVMPAAYLVAIMLQTGRLKDFARVKQFFEQEVVTEDYLQKLIKRFGLEDQWQKYLKLS
jgi:hypothetical protein